MVDLIVVAVIVAPAIPIVVLRSIGAAEMIDTVLLPTLGIDLRPFHHSVAAERGVCHTGSRSVHLLGVVIWIEIVVDHAGIGQHTWTRHKLLTGVKRPAAVIEYAGAEIHRRRSICCIVHIGRISYTTGGTGSGLDKVVAEQIISLLRSDACPVGFTAVVCACTGVWECGVVIHHTDRYISIGVSAVSRDVFHQIALSLRSRITGRTLADHGSGNAARKLAGKLYLNRIESRYIDRLGGERLHRLRFVNNDSVCLVAVVDSLRSEGERRIVICAGSGSRSVGECTGCLKCGYQVAVKLVTRIIGCLSPNNCALHGAKGLVIDHGVLRQCRCDKHHAIRDSRAECQHVGRLNAAEEVTVFTKDQIFFCHFDFSFRFKNK